MRKFELYECNNVKQFKLLFCFTASLYSGPRIILSKEFFVNGTMGKESYGCSEAMLIWTGYK